MSNIIDAEKPTVRIDGVDRTDMFCLQIEEQSGTDFSKALLRYAPGRFAESPITLKDYGAQADPYARDFQYGQRVVIYNESNSRIYFNGWLVKRQDDIGSDAIYWTAYGDQWLLQYIPIRGCLVKDLSGDLKFSTRHLNQVNPGGMWNCTGYDFGGGNVYPVFTPTAYRCTAYTSPTETFDGDSYKTYTVDGTSYNPWTPRRYLQYLQLLATIYATNGSAWPDGMDGNKCNCLNSDINLTWEKSSITNLVGYDPANPGNDPLDRKMPEANFNGDTLLGGIRKTLDIFGTHEMKILYDSGSGVSAGKSKVYFMPWGYTASGTGSDISLQREGSAGDAFNGELIDATLDSSAETTYSTVLVEGDMINVETSVEYVRTSPSTSTILPAWTSDEEEAFLLCVFGGTKTEVENDNPGFAKISETHTDLVNFVACDGTSDKPLVYPATKEAIAYARECFPNVYRAWKINPDLISTAVLAPSDSSVALNAPRPILAQQLQFYLRDLSGVTSAENWMLERMPIRVEVKDDNGDYVEVPRDIAVKITADGTIWIDGIAEPIDGDRHCVYRGSLMDKGDYLKDYNFIRDVRINIAFPTDTRVNGYTVKNISGDIDSSLTGAFQGAGLLKYVDRPNSYRHDYQYNSTPAASPKYYAGESGIEAPLSRSLPPGSEAVHATYESERLAATAKNLRRDTKWSMWGIRVDLRAAGWLNKVYLNYDGYTNEYIVNAAVPSVHWDFEKQITTLAGVLGEYDT